MNSGLLKAIFSIGWGSLRSHGVFADVLYSYIVGYFTVGCKDSVANKNAKQSSQRPLDFREETQK